MTTTDTRLAIDLSLVVAAKKPVAEDVVALYLTAPDGSDLPAWSPGAHVDLVLDDGVMRQYSLCGDIRDVAMWRIAVLREAVGRGGSKHVHDALAAGTPVQVRGPRNRFGLVEADRYLFIAGGIGITPILPMIAAVEAAGREWRLLYGGRQRTSMAFLEELSRNGSRVSIQPQDESGLLDLDSVLDAPEPDTAVYCCGPEALLAAVEKRCQSWPADALHVERFSASPEEKAGQEQPIEVVLQQSQRTLQVPPDTSILHTIEAAGVDVPSSCQEGTCGTCETDVLEGTPDHRDHVLSKAERERGDCMMICVSRCHGPRLVLDL